MNSFNQQIFFEAVSNIKAHRIRSLLSLIGIAIGCAALVSLISLVQMAQHHALESFQGLGTNAIAISISSHNAQGAAALQQFSSNDIKSIKQCAPHIQSVAPYLLANTTLKEDVNIKNIALIGATEALQSLIKIDMKQGRFVSDLDHYQNFCVLGEKQFDALSALKKSRGIGGILTLDNRLFTIIGIAKPWRENGFFYQNVNEAIIISLPLAQKIFPELYVNQILIHCDDQTDEKGLIETKQQLIHFFETRFPNTDILVRSSVEIMNRMKQQAQTLELLLAFVGSITLLVGSVGIMNVMLAALSERKKEIGLRRAVGATPKHILNMFLIETCILCLLGGIFGVVLGLFIAKIIAWLWHWTFYGIMLSSMVGVIAALSFGVISGLYPALRAARVDPVRVLRGEAT